MKKSGNTGLQSQQKSFKEVANSSRISPPVVTPQTVETAKKAGLMPSREALKQSLQFRSLLDHFTSRTKLKIPSTFKKQVFEIPQLPSQPPVKIAIAQSSEPDKTPEYTVQIIGDQRSIDPSIIYAASALQAILNAIQRQILGNLGLRALANDKPAITPAFLLGGIAPRILNNLGGIMPSLMLKKEMQAAGYGRLETVIAATALETLTGAPLEA